MNASSRLLVGLVLATACGTPSYAETDREALLEDGHDCLVEPHALAEVGSPVQGVLARVLVERGEPVVRGQPLAELESGPERALLEQAEARAAMESEVVTREADLALARLDRRRFEDLHARDLAPAQQRDEAVARERIAAAALVQALENRKLHQLELARTRALLEQRTIRSPVDGVVVQRLIAAGELVLDDPVMRVADLDPLAIEVVLPSRLFGLLRAGDPASVSLELDPERTVEARVAVVDPMLDARSGTFGARLLLPNPDGATVAGQKCHVTFEARAASGDASAGLAAALPERATERRADDSNGEGAAAADRAGESTSPSAE